MTSYLQRIQNYAEGVILRILISCNINTHLKLLHWLPAKVRSTKIFLYAATTVISEQLHHTSLIATENAITTPQHLLLFRQMPLLNRTAHNRATLGGRSFPSTCSLVRNTIPNDVRCATSMSLFSSRMKTYLFRSVYKGSTFSWNTIHMCIKWLCH